MPTSFASATDLRQTAEGRFQWEVPDGWQQGRGAFGGLVLGALAKAMQASEPDLGRRLRTFTGDVAAPVVVGEVAVSTHVLRRGSNQTNLGASLVQNGVVAAQATAVLATPRKVPPRPVLPASPPPAPPADDVPAITLQPFGPRFAESYEYRPTGPLPFGGGAEPLVVGWVRERVSLAELDAAALLGRLDAHWPALFSMLEAPRPCATVSFLAEILANPGDLDPTAPMLYRGRAIAEADGYFTELRELWLDGKIVALNQQVFAVLV